MSPAEASKLFSLLQLGGLNPQPAILASPREASQVYAGSFTRAGVSFAEAEAAVLAYNEEPDAGQFPKPWPDPGKLIARTPTARRLASFANDLDVTGAWIDFMARRRSVNRYSPDEACVDAFNDDDEHREEAMRFALADTGGVSAWFDCPPADLPHLERRWKDAYRAVRQGQRQDPAVALAITAAARLAIETTK